MPEIKPFRGVLYNQASVCLDEVVAPPYDVISPNEQQKLYERSPLNAVRLILGREQDRYASAAQHLEEWVATSVLQRDGEPAFYVLWQTFRGANGRELTRKGFIALCRLEDFDSRVVLPHEKTHTQPREDRLRLFKATNANMSPVFALYSDPERAVERLMNRLSNTLPCAELDFDHVDNRMWKLLDEQTIEQIRTLMRTKQVLIADGHHRYETALAYRDWMRSQNPHQTGDEPYNYMMMYFTNVDEDGLIILPTHRLVHSLSNFEPKAVLAKLEQRFILHEYKDKESLLAALGSSPVVAFGLTLQGENMFYLLTSKPTGSAKERAGEEVAQEVRDLDVSVLHSIVVEDILSVSKKAQEEKRHLEYTHDSTEAIEAVRSGKVQIALLMNPTKIDQVRSVARAGHTMPHKSTFFYPKLPSGLVFNLMTG
jgi:uncharacterized protein (DUF1015 family)